MEGEHGKVDMICPSLVTSLNLGKEVLAVSNDINEKKHIYFCPFFCFFFFVI